MLFSIARVLPFIVDAFSYVGSMTAIAATKARFQLQTSRPSWRTVGTDIAEGVGWLRGEPFYRTTSLLFAVGNPVYSVYTFSRSC